MFQIHSTSSNTKRNTDIIETHARRKKREIDYSQNKIKKHNRIDINITDDRGQAMGEELKTKRLINQSKTVNTTLHNNAGIVESFLRITKENYHSSHCSSVHSVCTTAQHTST